MIYFCGIAAIPSTHQAIVLLCRRGVPRLDQLLEDPSESAEAPGVPEVHFPTGMAQSQQDEFKPPVMPHIALSGVSATLENNNPDTTYQQILPTIM